MARRSGLIVAGVVVGALGCGRTDLLLLVDTNADESTTEWVSDTSSGDGDGDWETTDTGPGDGDGDGDPCQDTIVELSAEPSTVVFLIDQGQHMSGNFAGVTRLEAIGQALFDPMQGVAYTWEAERRLGLAGFTSVDGDAGGECPMLIIEAPELLTAMAMEGTFAALQPIDENPVADALTASLALFDGEPGHVIVLTGRNPDTCAQPNPQQGDAEAVLAAQAAFAAGVETHLVGVGNLTGAYPQALANAGAGLDPQGMVNAPWLAPGNVAQLRTGLDGILQSLASCSLTMSVALMPGDEGLCTVALDGQGIALGDPDGWSLAGPDQMLLSGGACAALQQGAVASMVCACP